MRRAAACLGVLLGLSLVLPSSYTAAEGTAPDRAGTVATTALLLSGLLSGPPSGPLSGIRIAIDPGHQLGNHRFPRQINRLVPAGGFQKPCNTTGTATDWGYPEATVNYRIAWRVKKRLRALGARVWLTRDSNSEDKWGPCVDARGRFGRQVGARLTVSLHADGAAAGSHGFHVIAPRSRDPWTTDIAVPSLRLAKALRGGMDAAHFARSNYVGHGTALNVRSDLGTLNMSDVPVAMIEIGNMRDSADGHRMTAAAGQDRYAQALVRGIRRYLSR